MAMASPMGSVPNPISTTVVAQSTSLHYLYRIKKKIVHDLELAGSVMEELGNAACPHMDVVDNQCLEFMGSIKVPFLVSDAGVFLLLEFMKKVNLTTAGLTPYVLIITIDFYIYFI
jgi:hypothetical protein